MDEDSGEVTRKGGGLASLKVGGGKRPRKEDEEEEGPFKGMGELCAWAVDFFKLAFRGCGPFSLALGGAIFPCTWTHFVHPFVPR